MKSLSYENVSERVNDKLGRNLNVDDFNQHVRYQRDVYTYLFARFRSIRQRIYREILLVHDLIIPNIFGTTSNINKFPSGFNQICKRDFFIGSLDVARLLRRASIVGRFVSNSGPRKKCSKSLQSLKYL